MASPVTNNSVGKEETTAATAAAAASTSSHLVNGGTSTPHSSPARSNASSSSSNKPGTSTSATAPDYTSIAKLYTDRSVFITGGTGFMGKVLVEKLLRSCPGIKNIYLLIRPKKGQETAARLNDLLNTPVSEEAHPSYRNPISITPILRFSYLIRSARRGPTT